MAKLALILGLAMLPMVALADPGKVRSRTGHVAEIRAVADGCDALFVDGREVWREHGRVQVTSAPRWSKSGHGVAFLVRADGAARLVVVLVDGETAGNTLSWAIPPRAARNVSWLGADRVAVGKSELEPEVIASWNAR